MTKVFIGVDPHRLSATIEVVDHHETVLATGRFPTDKAGYAAMRKHVAAWPVRTWAVEGCNAVPGQDSEAVSERRTDGQRRPETRP